MRSRPARSAPSGSALPVVSCFVVVLASFVAVAVAVALHGAPFGVDAAVHRWFLAHRSGTLDRLALLVTSSGTGVFAYVVAAVAGLLLAGSRTTASGRLLLWGAPAGMAALGATQLLRAALASAFARPRPPLVDRLQHVGGFSFPSGHTTTSALAAGLVCVAAVRAPITGRIRVLGLSLALGWSAAVGLTRVYLGVHWPSDVVGGWLLAAVLVLGGVVVLEWTDRRAAHREQAT